MQPDLFSTPFANSPDARATACSKAGATFAKPRVGSQADRVLASLREHGPQSMHDLHTTTGLVIPTICARLGWLRKRGLVEVIGAKAGPHGVKVPNTLWGIRR